MDLRPFQKGKTKNHIHTSAWLYCLINFTLNTLTTPSALHEKSPSSLFPSKHFQKKKKWLLYLQTLILHLFYMRENLYRNLLSKEFWFRWKDLELLCMFVLQVIPWIKLLGLKINQCTEFLHLFPISQNLRCCDFQTHCFMYH